MRRVSEVAVRNFEDDGKDVFVGEEVAVREAEVVDEPEQVREKRIAPDPGKEPALPRRRDLRHGAKGGGSVGDDGRSAVVQARGEAAGREVDGRRLRPVLDIGETHTKR